MMNKNNAGSLYKVDIVESKREYDVVKLHQSVKYGKEGSLYQNYLKDPQAHLALIGQESLLDGDSSPSESDCNSDLRGNKK